MEIPKEILDLLEDWPEQGEKPKFKPQQEVCEDCNLVVENRRVDLWISPEGKKHFAHWKYKCSTCKLYKNPNTGKFDLNHKDAHQVFKTFYNK